jgi:DNA-binding response OmpR family regulator
MEKVTIELKWCLKKILCVHERIAVVDDEPDIMNVLKKGFERNGFTVDIFNDPQAAPASIRPRYYDLVIIDIQMPRMNGLTCTDI